MAKERKEDEKLSVNGHMLFPIAQSLHTFSSGYTWGQTSGTLDIKVLMRTT